MGQYYKPILLDKTKKTIVSFMESWDFTNGSKLMEHSWIGNKFVASFESLIRNKPTRVVWAGDYADEEKTGKSLYSISSDNENLKVIPELRVNLIESRFIINHSKELFVDKRNCPKDKDGWRIHPLPLLTSDGNGRGGGDYYSSDMELVGSWCRDIISVSQKKPIGMKELKPNFIETRG
jgi:hypothetical protein